MIFIPHKYLMVILDTSFQSLISSNCDFSFTELDSIFSRPYSSDLIAIRIYHSYPEQVLNTLEFLAKRSKKIILAITEPTHPEFISLEKKIHSQFDNVIVFANAVTNYPSHVKTNINWFLGTTNLYSQCDWGINLLTKLEHGTERPKKFDCLLGSRRKSRDLIEQFYLKSNNKDDFIFTYYKDNLQKGIWDFDTSSITHSVQSVNWDGATPSASQIIPVEIYNQSYYSIVAETIQFNEYSFFTEKVAKPLVSRRPFIAFAGVNYLANLRKLGFLTFDCIVDESYDQEPNPEKRYAMAWQQVEYLLNQNPDCVLQQCKNVIDHNANWFLQTDWNKDLKLALNCDPITRVLF